MKRYPAQIAVLYDFFEIRDEVGGGQSYRPTPAEASDVVGLAVEQVSHHVGTYGMGGPGFFGLRLGDRWLVVALWGAADWMLAQGRLVGDVFYDVEGGPQAWIGSDFDELSPRILGRLLSALEVQPHSLRIVFDDGFEIVIDPNPESRPILYGSKEPRAFAPEEDLRKSVFLAPTDVLWV